MKYKLNCTVNAPSQNAALGLLYQMLFFADVEAEDIAVELVDIPTKEDIKFLAEQASIGDIEALQTVVDDIRYPHIDELLGYFQEHDGPDAG